MDLVLTQVTSIVKLLMELATWQISFVELEKHIQVINAKKLLSLCKTRWLACIDAVEVFFDLYPAVVNTLFISEGCTTGWNVESCWSAKFRFLMAYVVTKQCLQYTKGLTMSLQKRAGVCFFLFYGYHHSKMYHPTQHSKAGLSSMQWT